MTTYAVFYRRRELGFLLPGTPAPDAFRPIDFRHVADVDARDLEELYREMNVVDGDETAARLGVRSLSVGDVAFDRGSRTAFYCADMGWKEIPLEISGSDFEL